MECVLNFTDKFIRSQLALLKPFVEESGLDLARAAQNKMGKLMSHRKRRDAVPKDFEIDGMPASVFLPRDEVRSGIILYIHGGGYTSGNLEYAKGFAAILASECGMRAMCFEYRLAPEYPYPAALNDSMRAYRYLLSEGYLPENIVLAGESAGGGLCYALCIRLREISVPLPAGIIALSPWCDLTMSGESHKTNLQKDPSLSVEKLTFFADCYTGAVETKRENKKAPNTESRDVLKKLPYLSPLFGDLSGMPPSIIFAGSDEILLSDSEKMHERLLSAGAESKLHIKKDMWHAYLLYGLKSQSDDYRAMNVFLKKVLPKSSQRKLRWFGLDNAAKIYPAAATHRWTNVFRLSATLREDVDSEVLRAALDVTLRRFPSIGVRLRRGTFWYYLEEVAHAPDIMPEKPYPLGRMPFDDIRSCAIRVLVYKKRIAVEFFHAVTDGNGGLVFLKSLVAEYLSEKYSVDIPATHGVLDRLEPPSDEELVDNFPKIAGKYPKTRKDTNAYKIYGEREGDGFFHNTTFILSSDELYKRAKEYGVSVTAYLAAAFIKAGIELQREDVVHQKNMKPVKVLIPCDLRRIYKDKSKTMRNFALYATPGVDPRLGEYSFGELCSIVYHQMKLEITEKNMSAMAKTNVKDEQNLLLQLAPLFLKNIVMKLVFNLIGECKSTLTVSNLGVVELPEEMKAFVDRLDFTLGTQESAPYNAGIISYKGVTHLNFIRNIKEPRLEMALYLALKGEGVHVKVESNGRD